MHPRNENTDYYMKPPLISLLVAGIWFAIDCAAATDAPADNRFAIREVRVFDGTRDLGETTVIVENGLVTAVARDAVIPAGMLTIDGRGKTLLPGFIDAHTHSWGDAQQDALRFGVTAELDMMGDWNRLPALKLRRDSLSRSAEADLWSAGAAVTAPGGHGTQYGYKVPTLAADGDAAEFVGARVREGSDYIKLIVEDMSAYSPTLRRPTLTPAQLKTATAAAHRAGKLAVVHVSLQKDALQAVQDGADGLVHVFVDTVVDDRFVQVAKERSTFMVATLSVLAGVARAGEGEKLAAESRLKPFLSEGQKQNLAAAFPSTEQQSRYLQRAQQNVRALHTAGVPVLAGTDAGNPGTAHGVSLHGELELLVRSGLTPAEALTAATALPAKIFGLAGRGRIAPSSRADLVLVEGDPTVDITATRAIVGIWKNGYVVDRAIPVVPAAASAAPAAGGTLISDFDADGLKAKSGFGWQPTTDQIAGGASQVSHRLISGGARGTPGALEVKGEIKAGFAYPWAGVMYFPGTAPMQPVDFSARKELVFQARGDGRTYQVLVFSGPSMQSQPSVQSFAAGSDWREVRVPLAQFAGADFSLLRGIAFSAAQPEGAFEFRLDQVELR